MKKGNALTAKDRIFVAIDVDTLAQAETIMDDLKGLVTNVKVGLQVGTREGWSAVVTAAHQRGFKVFCDTKFKDIPNTVEHATAALAELQPEYFTVMADNSLAALRAARTGAPQPKIIGVTVLTSISAEESQVIYGGDPKTKAKEFGASAAAAGFDAIVCSPEEIATFRSDNSFKDVLIVTPGVRPAWAASNDQQRVMTPAEAIKQGADMLVIGRPITQPPAEVGTVKEAVTRIIKEIEEALA